MWFLGGSRTFGFVYQAGQLDDFGLEPRLLPLPLQISILQRLLQHVPFVPVFLSLALAHSRSLPFGHLMNSPFSLQCILLCFTCGLFLFQLGS